MNSAALFLLPSLLFVAFVEAGNTGPGFGSQLNCLATCNPRRPVPNCRPNCGCYRERDSPWYGMCLSPYGPFPYGVNPKYLGPIRHQMLIVQGR
uniref:Putative secreted protein n=1 Tax=Amblyomma triste TaxID=251400 RepID=A0A023G1B1_AMBTT